MTDELPVPDGWVRKPLGEAARLVRDKVDPRTVPDAYYVGLEHIEAHTMRLLGHGRGSDVRSAKTKFAAGDVLYGKLRPYLNKVAQPPFDGISSTDFLVFSESNDLDSSYLAQFLNQLSVAEYAHQVSAGVELPRVDWKSLSVLPVSFPASKSEQRKIVEQIERARSLATSSKEHLAATRRALDRFRQAVLAAACSGRLTADWREANRNTPSVEYALANPDFAPRRRQSPEVAVDLDLPDLPETYLVGTVGDAATVIEYGTSKRCDATSDRGVPVLRMGNIQNGELNLQDLKYCVPDGEIERLMLKDGDLLFNRTNSPELVGKCAVFHESEAMSFASYLIRVRFAPDVALPDFASFWINSAWGRAWARQAKTDGVSQSNINGSKLALMPLPLPPIKEQHIIVERVSLLLSRADRIAQTLVKAERQIQESSQAVLANAFRGELLPNGLSGDESGA